jgi:hypothetical protein
MLNLTGKHLSCPSIPPYALGDVVGNDQILDTAGLVGDSQDGERFAGCVQGVRLRILSGFRRSGDNSITAFT